MALVAVHRLASALRLHPRVARLAGHQVRVLVEHGRVRGDQLRRCGLTHEDLAAHLRQRGVFDLDHVRCALDEAKGGVTVVPEAEGPVPPLVREGLDRCTGRRETGET